MALSADFDLQPLWGVEVNDWRKVALRLVNEDDKEIRVDDIRHRPPHALSLIRRGSAG